MGVGWGGGGGANVKCLGCASSQAGSKGRPTRSQIKSVVVGDVLLPVFIADPCKL